MWNGALCRCTTIFKCVCFGRLLVLYQNSTETHSLEKSVNLIFANWSVEAILYSNLRIFNLISYFYFIYDSKKIFLYFIYGLLRIILQRNKNKENTPVEQSHEECPSGKHKHFDLMTSCIREPHKISFFSGQSTKAFIPPSLGSKILHNFWNINATFLGKYFKTVSFPTDNIIH